MSGGRLVVQDRAGRDVKQYPLPSGLATLGRDHDCDIRIILSSVSPHHATVVVHANQTVVRNVSDGETLVNGQSISVAALRHNDIITIGDRSLRWEYDDVSARRPLAPEPALDTSATARGRARERRRATAGGGVAPRPKHLQIALEMQHRASMPGNAGGKQVAIVQPQRRDTNQQSETNSRSVALTGSPRQKKRPRSKEPEVDSDSERPSRSPKTVVPHNTTKATMWIESRKTSPRRSAAKAHTPQQVVMARRVVSAKKSTPLRVAVLRNVQSAHKMRITKIQAPLKIDQTKQAAIMLMTGHTPKAKVTPKQSRKTPNYVVKRPSPVARTLTPSRRSKGSSIGLTPSRGSTYDNTSRRTSDRSAQSISVLEITDSDATNSTIRASTASRRSKLSIQGSPLLPSPKKSALKDPAAKKSIRKTESIKFDLSNLESHSEENDHDLSEEDDLTLHYSDASSTQSPSPRKSLNSRSSKTLEKLRTSVESRPESTVIPESPGGRKTSNSRSSKILEKLGTSVESRPESTVIPESPGGRKSLNSRSSKILEKLGTSIESRPESTVTPESPRARKSLRGSTMVQKVLESPGNTSHSRRTTKSVTDRSFDTTAESAFKTRTLSPRSTRNLESYSIVDLISFDSNNSTKSASLYDSVGSTRSSSIMFGTPQNSGRKTRSTIDPNLLTSSTPYVQRPGATRSSSNPNISGQSPNKSTRSSGSRRSKSLSTPDDTQKSSSNPNISGHSPNKSTRSSGSRRSKSLSTPDNTQKFSSNPNISGHSPNKSTRSSGSRRSKSLSTPDNTQKHISVNSTRISRGSRSRSRINDSDLQYVSSGLEDVDDSPKTSRRPSRAKSLNSPKSSPQNKQESRKKLTINTSSADSNQDGLTTPDNRNSPEEVGTPVLSIQSLLDSSQGSLKSLPSSRKKGGISKRKTIGVIRSERKKTRSSIKSKSLNLSARNLRLSKDSAESNKTDENSPRPDNEDTVTPKSAVKLVPEAVKNKHSTAKKPQSKRSIIDNLNESDIVKQLFNSPVKRKLSQSMTEFSRKQLFDDDNVVPRRPTRNTIALTGRTPDNSLQSHTGDLTPDNLVSPLSTPGNSPNLTGIKRLFKKNTPENDLRNVKGVKGLLKTPRTRKSIKNDLTKISGVKQVFAKSPKNRLSDVRVKEAFAVSPRNDLRRVTGVNLLFQSQKKQKSPKNDLTDVRGVRSLYQRKSIANDLRNVSGVKNVLRNSPKNDLRDVRGVRRMFRQEKEKNYDDVSGIEELFNESNVSRTHSETLFDQLVGKPPIKAVYSKSYINKKIQKRTARRARSLRDSIELITTNVDEWLEQELQKHLHKNTYTGRELQKLATDTVEGSIPIRTSRTRNSTINHMEVAERKKSASELYSAHKLPIKKRSLSGNPVKKSLFVNMSLEKRNDVSVLPIKKRVVHSTPVKGKYNVTMNASELGRVSPIPAVDKTSNLDADIRSTQPKGRTKVQIIIDEDTVVIEKNHPKAKSALKRKNKTKELENLELHSPLPKQTRRATREIQHSPKKTRKSTKDTQPSPKQAKRATREIKQSPKLATRSTGDIQQSPKQATRSTGDIQQSPKQVKRATVEIQPSPKQATRSAGDIQQSPKQVKRAAVEIQQSPKQATRSARDIQQSPKQVKRAAVEIQQSPKQTTRSARDIQQSPKQVKRATGELQQSPKQATRDIPRSPKQAKRATRGKAVTQKEEITIERKTRRTRNNTEKQEIVEAKVSPKPKGRMRNNTDKDEEKVSPKPRRNAKVVEQKVEEKPKNSPKKTRASKTIKSPVSVKNNTRSLRIKTNTGTNVKNRRASLVITKKPPVLSPKRPKAQEVKESPKKTRRQKAHVETKTPTKSRATVTKNSVILSKPSPLLKPQGSKTRGRKAEFSLTKSPQSKKQESKKSPPKPKIGRKNESETIEEPKPKRGRNAKQSVDAEPQPKRGRNTRTNNAQVSLQEPKTKGKKLVTQERVQAEPVRSNRRTKVDSEPTLELPTRGRKRKVDDRTSVSPKATKTRGKGVKIEVIPPAPAKGKQKKESKMNKEVVVEKTMRGRGKGGKGKAEEAKPVRGWKAAAAPAAAAAESAPETSRKRKTNSTASPAKAAKRARGAAAKASAAESGSRGRTRGHTSDTDKAVAQSSARTTRSRRR